MLIEFNVSSDLLYIILLLGDRAHMHVDSKNFRIESI